MKRKKGILAVLLIFLLNFSHPAFGASSYAELPEVDIWARSAILVHAQKDEVLYAHNIHIRREPASVTKIMTVLLALEFGSPDDVVTAEEIDFLDIVTTHRIKAGEMIRLGDLIHYAMLQSNNEACNMIARHVAGSVPAFMELVNSRLAEIGCQNTQFTNPHGLPDPPSDLAGRVTEHYTTAFDIYLMAKECMSNTKFMQIAHLEAYTMPPTNLTPDGRKLETTNALISRRTAEYYYPLARGGKTGFTSVAGNCLVSFAEKNGITLISVVLGAFREEETNLDRRYTETIELFEWGFNNFGIKTILRKVDKLTSVKVIQGADQDEVFLVPERSVEALVPSFLSPEDIKNAADISVYEPGGVRAPVKQGDVLGEIRLRYGDNDFIIPLVADRSVERDTYEAIQNEVGNVFDMIFGPRGEEDGSSGSLSWIKWAALGTVCLVILYIATVVVLNRRRRRSNMRASGYRGRGRY